MAITSRHLYTALDRVTLNDQRLYNTVTGNLPSVTTILSATKSPESTAALAAWRRRVGVQQAQRITTEAAARGTKMHSYLEHYIQDSELKPKPGNLFHHPSWHMAETVINHGLINCQEFWGVEVGLYYPSIYAGTTDCVGVHNGSPAIIDFKQANKPKSREWIEDYFLQLAAYSECHNAVYNTDISTGVIMMCVRPTVDDTGQIISQPQYQEFVITDAEFEKYRVQWWKRVEQYYSQQRDS